MSKIFQTLKLELSQSIAELKINNPAKANALPSAFWGEIKEAFQYLDETPVVRVIVLSGEGKHFCAGLDLSMISEIQAINQRFPDPGRAREQLRNWILSLQSSFTAIEQCRKPVIAAVQGYCIGAGVDMISACDMRYCTQDAVFQVKEVDLAIVADLGTIQRLPRIISEGLTRELVFTGRTVSASEAQEIQLVNRHYESAEAMREAVWKVATEIANKSPLTVRGAKEMLNYSRDHSLSEGLQYVATWNAAMLMSDDLNEALLAQMHKRDAQFKD
ncbi:MAG: crotonase/enoyl-CoA hydratase family protein [Bacteroidia bacterium]|nr:crotonase/enoyl-CoA hydratase family protein [Bacteroidia bacterium]